MVRVVRGWVFGGSRNFEKVERPEDGRGRDPCSVLAYFNFQ